MSDEVFPKIELPNEHAQGSGSPAKLLDGIIKYEKKLQNGFSLYNQGKQLKKSLICTENVRDYLSGKGGAPRGEFNNLPGATVMESML